MPIEDFLIHAVDILDGVTGQDATGGMLLTHPVLYTAVPAKVEDVPQMGEAQREMFDQPVMQNFYRVFFLTSGPAGNVTDWNGKYMSFEGGVYRFKERDKRRETGNVPGFLCLHALEYVP